MIIILFLPNLSAAAAVNGEKIVCMIWVIANETSVAKIEFVDFKINQLTHNLSIHSEQIKKKKPVIRLWNFLFVNNKFSFIFEFRKNIFTFSNPDKKSIVKYINLT